MEGIIIPLMIYIFAYLIAVSLGHQTSELHSEHKVPAEAVPKRGKGEY